MRYVISDIHGEYGLFNRLMEKIKFSATDELYVCGDVVDKGRDSIRLLKQIFSMPNAVCILGNHEYAFLKYYWALMKSSPDDFDAVLKKLQNYFIYPDNQLLDWPTVDRLESLPAYYECDDFICVHAGLPVDGNSHILPPQSVPTEFLVNDRTFKNPNVLPLGTKCVFFGHTPVRFINDCDKIITYKRVGRTGGSIGDYCKVHLDTGVYLSGVLGCFCVDNCNEYYVTSKEK